MNNRSTPQLVLQQHSGRKKRNVIVLLLALVLPIVLVPFLCVNASRLLTYQWNRGTYYGYVTIDDPTMTIPQNVGDIASSHSWQVQVQSMHFVKKNGATFLVVHVRTDKNTSDPSDPVSLADTVPGQFVVYTSPVFDASTGNSHAYTGDAISPVPSHSSSFDIDDADQMIVHGTSAEGDILFEVPSQKVSFVLVLTISPYAAYAWNSTPIDECQFVPREWKELCKTKGFPAFLRWSLSWSPL